MTSHLVFDHPSCGDSSRPAPTIGVKRTEAIMAAAHPIEVLEKRLRDLLEQYESDLLNAVGHVTQRYSGKRERD
jgi:hypothetical protein